MLDATACPYQSMDEVAPVIRMLQTQIDPQLNIRWDPQAVLVSKGGFDAMGQIIDAVWSGRWAVVREDDPDVTISHRRYRKVCYVSNWIRLAPGIYGMESDGPYRHVTEQLVTHLQANLQVNLHRIEEVKALNERSQQQYAKDLAKPESDRAREGLHQFYHQHTQEAGVSHFHPVLTNLT